MIESAVSFHTRPVVKTSASRMRAKALAAGKGYLFCSFLATFLFTCAGSSSLQPSGTRRIIPRVPFFPQEIYQCGPASLAMVLNYWGVTITPESIADEIYSPSAKGTLNVDLALFAEKKGLKAYPYRGGMEDLKENVDSARPLIVLVDYGFGPYERNHFMVVVGYDAGGVVVNSGKDREKWIAQESFLKAWGRTKFWTLRIEPKG
jgi:hypothetical protein